MKSLASGDVPRRLVSCEPSVCLDEASEKGEVDLFFGARGGLEFAGLAAIII